jgi:hypothetical protein
MGSHALAFAQGDEAALQERGAPLQQVAAVVTAVELIEKNGDRTVIELKNIRKNEAIGSDRFAVH